MTDSYVHEREQMVARQLAGRGIRDPRVLAAMLRVPRHEFVEPSSAPLAYADQAIGIDCRQTISQPYIVALMSEVLALQGGERVLEIGTGSGYQAAVLAELRAEVFTIERHAPLARRAIACFARLGYSQIHVRVGDGRLGWMEESPFDRVIITAATEEVPSGLWQQLRPDGFIIAPLGPAHSQVLQKLRLVAGQVVGQPLTECRFVPLLSGLPDISSEPGASQRRLH